MEGEREREREGLGSRKSTSSGYMIVWNGEKSVWELASLEAIE